MTIHAASKHIYQLLITIGLISLLAGCGGGGSSGPKKDSTPDAITFAPVTNAAVSTDVTSAPVTLSGFNQSVSISVTGGTYSIGGGAFIGTAGTVTNGQVVTVKVKSSDKTNTAVSATLTVGGVSGAFTVTTAPDVTPDAFSFTDAQGVGAKSVNTSNEITVAGIDVAVPISITNGEYSINGGAYTNVAGTVSKDQKVTVRVTASNQAATGITSVLTIGGVTGNFVITTKADNAAPTAQILFPPPVSMTEGNTILVRGSASDEFSSIASVKVNGVAVTPKAAGDFSSWTVSVPLTATSDNDVVVTVEDSVGNKSTNAAKVMVRQGDHKNAFPDANNNLRFAGDFKIDNVRNRLLVVQGRNITSVDLMSGKRNMFIDFETATLTQGCSLMSDVIIDHLYCIGEDIIKVNLLDGSYEVTEDSYDVKGVVVDDTSAQLKLVTTQLHDYGDYNDGELVGRSLVTNVSSIISSATQNIPDSNNPLVEPYGIALDKASNRYLVSVGSQSSEAVHAIYAVDKLTGARTVFSSSTVGSGPEFTSSSDSPDAGLSGLKLDDTNQRLLVTEWATGKIFSIDLVTGNRSIIGDGSMENMPVDGYRFAWQIEIASSGEYAFVSDTFLKGIFAIDLVTGKRVIFSKSASED